MNIKQQYKHVCGALRRMIHWDMGASCDEEDAYLNNRHMDDLYQSYPDVYEQAHITVMGYKDPLRLSADELNYLQWIYEEQQREEDNKRQWDEYFEEEYRAGRM